MSVTEQEEQFVQWGLADKHNPLTKNCEGASDEIKATVLRKAFRRWLKAQEES